MRIGTVASGGLSSFDRISSVASSAGQLRRCTVRFHQRRHRAGHGGLNRRLQRRVRAAGESADDQIAHRQRRAVHLERRDGARDAADAAFAVGHREDHPVLAGIDRHHRRENTAVPGSPAFSVELLQLDRRRHAAALLVHDRHADRVVERLGGQPFDFGGDQHAHLAAARFLVGPRRQSSAADR